MRVGDAETAGTNAEHEGQRRILVVGHPVLRRKAAPVTEIDDRIRELVRSLFATMYAAPGVGLAAPQVDESVRVCVIDPARAEEPTEKLALINPEIKSYSGNCSFEEGCLSIPGIYAEVHRPELIEVRFLDPDGREQTREFGGMMARVIQHELDHLNGKLFVDHLSGMRRALLRKKLREIETSHS